MRPPQRFGTLRRRVVGALIAAISLLGLTAVHADELGRLFYTPQQRAELDRQRDMSTAEPQAAGAESLVTINGNVVRSSGKTTTWVNGVAQHDAARGRDPSRPVVVDGDTSVRVKVGQTYDRTQGETHDPLGTGEIRIAPPPAR